MRFRRRAAPAIAAMAAFAAFAAFALAAPSAGAPDRPPCEPDGSVTLARSHAARVYQVERRRGDRATLYTYACLRRTGSQVLLASDAEPAALFPRPSISLNGPYVGYAVDTDTDPSAPGGRMTYVEVDDLRPQEPGSESVGLVTNAGPRKVARVGSLKVSPRGSVAWIACPAPRDNQLAADPAGNCSRPGAGDRVYRASLDRGGAVHVKLLDRGRVIDPHSMRRTRTGVAWRHGEKVRLAKLR
jgi:hypothetical protein